MACTKTVKHPTGGGGGGGGGEESTDPPLTTGLKPTAHAHTRVLNVRGCGYVRILVLSL